MDTVGSSVQFRLDKTTTSTGKPNDISAPKQQGNFLTKQPEFFPVHATKEHRESNGITKLILNL